MVVCQEIQLEVTLYHINVKKALEFLQFYQMFCFGLVLKKSIKLTFTTIGRPSVVVLLELSNTVYCVVTAKF